MTNKGILEAIDTDISIEEQAIRRVAFHAILDGEAIDRAGLVVATGLMPEKVDALLDGLAGRGLVVVEPDSGRVVGSWGLSLVPADHRLHIRGRALYTWCAEDAVGIPAGLGEDASIISNCRQCGVSVNVEMAAGQVARAEPPDVRLWVTAGDVGGSVVGFT
jgi:alkylmercury lyase